MSERHELSGRLLGICDALEAGCQLNKPKLKSYLYRASEILAKPDSQEIESLRAEVQTLREYNKKVRKAAYDYLKSWEKVDLADVDATATIGTEAALNNALLSTQEQDKDDE